MTKSKHTQGPWESAAMHASQIGVYTKDNRRKEPIAVFFMGETDEWKEFKNSKANAALIAAAPDLLEALELAQAALNSDNPETVQYADKRARAAIAKAKGEA